MPGLTRRDDAFGAPELKRGKRSVAGDVYAAGRVLERLAAVGGSREHWAAIVRRATATAPGDRFASAVAMRAAIEAAMAETDRDWIGLAMGGLVAAAGTVAASGTGVAAAGPAVVGASLSAGGVATGSGTGAGLGTTLVVATAAVLALGAGVVAFVLTRDDDSAAATATSTTTSTVVGPCAPGGLHRRTGRDLDRAHHRPGEHCVVDHCVVDHDPRGAADSDGGDGPRLPGRDHAARGDRVDAQRVDMGRPVRLDRAGQCRVGDTIVAVLGDEAGGSMAVGLGEGGEERWRRTYPPPNGLYGPGWRTVFASGTNAVVTHGVDGSDSGPALVVVALDADSGEEVWQQQIAGATGADLRPGPGGTILVGADWWTSRRRQSSTPPTAGCCGIG